MDTQFESSVPVRRRERSICVSIPANRPVIRDQWLRRLSLIGVSVCCPNPGGRDGLIILINRSDY
jgi:hypothetical protein